MLRRQITEGRMVHATLISGEPGTGKRTLAGLLAKALLCVSEGEKPCGKCKGCLTADTGEHPDLILIEKGIPLSENTKKGRSTIPVDDIREMIRLCSSYPFEGGNRVVLVPDAENMTPQAQNSLLKILEEPPKSTFFILTSAHPEQLLTTVRSRCRPVKLKPWPEVYILRALTQGNVDREKAEKAARSSYGSIGKAFRLAADDRYWEIRDEVFRAFFLTGERSGILQFSQAWKDKKGEADILLPILEENVRLLLQNRLTGEPDLRTEGFPEEWARFAENANPERFSFLSDSITNARKQLSFNVSFQSVIEQLLLIFIGERSLWAV